MSGLKHRRESAAMEHYAGLDVSVKETSVCVIDGAGKTIREVKVATEPAAILAVLLDDAFAVERIGLEAGPLSQWLYSGLAERGLPMICVETRHMKAALSAQLNKSDRNDARGIAHMMRVGLYRPVHVKTLTSQKRRMLLTSRQLLQAKAIDIENDLRGTLRNFGLKVGIVGTAKFEARIRELVAEEADLAAIAEPLLIARRVLREQLGVLHRRLLAIVREDEVCRRLMTVPGIGPVVALTFRATVDEMRGCHDANHAVRCGPGHADPHHQVVVAEGLGHENRPATGNETGDRRRGTSNGGYHAPHVGRRYRVSLDKFQRRDRLSGPKANYRGETRVPPTGGAMSLAGTMVEASPSCPLCLPSV